MHALPCLQLSTTTPPPRTHSPGLRAGVHDLGLRRVSLKYIERNDDQEEQDVCGEVHGGQARKPDTARRQHSHAAGPRLRAIAPPEAPTWPGALTSSRDEDAMLCISLLLEHVPCRWLGPVLPSRSFSRLGHDVARRTCFDRACAHPWAWGLLRSQTHVAHGLARTRGSGVTFRLPPHARGFGVEGFSRLKSGSPPARPRPAPVSWRGWCGRVHTCSVPLVLLALATARHEA